MSDKTTLLTQIASLIRFDVGDTVYCLPRYNGTTPFLGMITAIQLHEKEHLKGDLYVEYIINEMSYLLDHHLMPVSTEEIAIIKQYEAIKGRFN